MPIIFKGNHICDNCKRRFDWIYYEMIKSRYSSGSFKAEVIPSEPKAHCVENNADNTYQVYVNCPHCGYDNIFKYEKI